MRLSRLCYLIVGVMFVLIGLLHLQVHFSALTTEDLASALDHSFDLLGDETNAWPLWQGFSFMMGVLLIFIGLFNLITHKSLAKNECPPIPQILLTMLILATVIFSGVFYFSSMQIYGGIFGMILLAGSLIAQKFGRKSMD